MSSVSLWSSRPAGGSSSSHRSAARCAERRPSISAMTSAWMRSPRHAVRTPTRSACSCATLTGGGTASARGREAVRVASVMPSGGPPRRYQRAPGHRQYHPPDVRGRIVRNPRTRTPRNGPGSGAEFRHICRRPIPVSPIRVRFGMVPPCGPLGQAAWAREPQPDHWPA